LRPHLFPLVQKEPKLFWVTFSRALLRVSAGSRLRFGVFLWMRYVIRGESLLRYQPDAFNGVRMLPENKVALQPKKLCCESLG
jgi:hypothetical protein